MKIFLTYLIAILSWIWQLPQHLVALVILLLNKRNHYTRTIDGITVHFVEHGVFKCGVSLGKYIILHKMFDTVSEKSLTMTAHHEYGHSKQSLMFGWLYLIVIGLPSACNNIYSRIYKKDAKWYYNRYPENWADKLGNVHRWD